MECSLIFAPPQVRIRPPVSDASGQPPTEGDERNSSDPEFRDDALSELMTGAYAATSMVAMGVKGGDSGVPAPPVWAPAEEAPPAEALDRASGSPTRVPSNPHVQVETEFEIDTDFDDPDDGERPPRLAPDIVESRASHAVTAPLSGPQPGGPLGPPSVSIPAAPEEYPAHHGFSQEEQEEEEEGAASISTDSGVVVTPQHAKGARLTGGYPTVSSSRLRSPAPRYQKTSSMLPWTIGAAVVVGVLLVGAVVMLSGRSSGDSSSAAELDDPSKPPEPAAAGVTLENPVPAQGPKPTAIDEAVPSTPGDVPPLPAKQADLPAPTEPGNPTQTYATALAQYEAEPSNPALLELTLKACSLGLGPDARTAFHKLVGGKVRSKAVVKCRESGVDVTSKVHGYTGPEIAQQARAALDKGDATGALALAKQSNRTKRNHAAIELMVLAHCQLKQNKAAKKMLRHVSEKRRGTVIRDCKSRGGRIR